MRVRGMEDVGWDPFVETHQLVTDLMTLINAPLVGYTAFDDARTLSQRTPRACALSCARVLVGLIRSS